MTLTTGTRYLPNFLTTFGLLVGLFTLLIGCTPVESENSLGADSEPLPTAESVMTPTLAPTLTPAPIEVVTVEPTSEPTETPLPEEETTDAPVDDDAAASDESASAELDMMQRTFYLHELQALDGSSMTLAGGPITLMIDAGIVSGNAACNNYSGTFSLTDQSLTIGSLATTRMACGPEIAEVENRFIWAMEAASELVMGDDGALRITHPEGVLLFREELPEGSALPSDPGTVIDDPNADDLPLLAPVDSFDITIDAGATSAQIVVRGTFTDGCGRVDSVEQDLTEDNRIYVSVKQAAPDPAAACMMVLTPYEHTVVLDLKGFKAGDYRIFVNDAEGSLTLNNDVSD